MTGKSKAQVPLLDHFAVAILNLPPVSSVISYEDRYDEVVRKVRTSEAKTELTLYVAGEKCTIYFERFDLRIRELIRIYIFNCMYVWQPGSVYSAYRALTRISASDIETVCSGMPNMVLEHWPLLRSKYLAPYLAYVRSLLSFLCNISFCHWTPTYQDYISRALSLETRDLYLTVRSGECFLDAKEESNIVRWIDDAVSRANQLTLAEAEKACVVVSSYQFGMRPTQLGRIRKRDCDIRKSFVDGSSIVHLTFSMQKQKDSHLNNLPLLRKVKREWAPLFLVLMKLKYEQEPGAFLFGFSSRESLATELNNTLSEIAASGKRRVSYDLRHTFAQRIVDAGASKEELAAGMGHTSFSTGLIYFKQSENQNALVNRALGLSKTYQEISKISISKTITLDELSRLKGDAQVAGTPHGIPISGIGGCQSGQAVCTLNPVISCYGCYKFMPVRDLGIHQHVLQEFRGVIRKFINVSRNDAKSPAFLQLQQTISDIQAVIGEQGLSAES